MEEKLIVAVCSHPVLYDQSSVLYRDRNKKDLAWRTVSEEVGMSVAVCKKRWKSLRDTYAKETKKERDRNRSGAGADTTGKWKYMAVMAFLKPFITPRETSGNMQDSFIEDHAAVDNGPEEPEEAEDESAFEASVLETIDCSELDLAHVSASAATSPCPATSSSTGSSEVADPSSRASGTQKRRRREQTSRTPQQETEFEKQLLDMLKSRNHPAATPQTPPPPPASETEKFLMSLVAPLERLPDQLRERAKFKIYSIIYEMSTGDKVNVSEQ
ncbi:transcription factor Adf-1 [Austrofundulus limnaeus]|uniref:Transcription factor Adf-1 n=1 Tax=Austrofundulus limnaeus TaxID=52670 RepID=A0A2I4AHP9_AUSLI|nr:PREDICTED: transcription factor Adf-1-like [Austrofundulus limnaeus]